MNCFWNLDHLISSKSNLFITLNIITLGHFYLEATSPWHQYFHDCCDHIQQNCRTYYDKGGYSCPTCGNCHRRDTAVNGGSQAQYSVSHCTICYINETSLKKIKVNICKSRERNEWIREIFEWLVSLLSFTISNITLVIYYSSLPLAWGMKVNFIPDLSMREI